MSETDQTMTPEDVAAIRREFMAVKDSSGPRPLSYDELAKQTGIPKGTLSSWGGGTYTGRNDKIAEEVQKWLRSRQDRQRLQVAAPAAPRFVETPTALRFLSVLRHCQHMPDFGVIAGEAGSSKTSAACHYTRTTPNVFKIVAEPCFSTPRALLDALGDLLGIQSNGNNHRQSNAISSKLRGTGALIIIDEAQHLTSLTLDQLRVFHDKANIGICLLGNRSVYTRLEGTARDAQFAQLFSRVGMRIPNATTKPADALKLIEAWGIEGDAQVKLLKAIASRPGALRAMTKTLTLAHMLAAGEDRTEVTAEDITAAHSQLSSRPAGGEA